MHTNLIWKFQDSAPGVIKINKFPAERRKIFRKIRKIPFFDFFIGGRVTAQIKGLNKALNVLKVLFKFSQKFSGKSGKTKN